MHRRMIVGLVVLGVIGGALMGGLSASAAKRPTSPGPLYGVLLGKNEIGKDGKKRAGDPDGRGSASAIYDAQSKQLCFGLTVKDIGQPVAAHIHRGTRGETGPPVVTLTPHPSAGDPGASSGCVAVPKELAQAILKNPRKFYWNVHTQDFPGGAVRGQVFAKTR